MITERCWDGSMRERTRRQKYKEGKFIFEKSKIIKENW